LRLRSIEGSKTKEIRERACVGVARGTRFNAAVYIPNIFPFNVKVINLFSINEQGMTHDTII